MRDDHLCLMIPFLFMRRTGDIIAWQPALGPRPGPTYLPKESSLARFCFVRYAYVCTSARDEQVRLVVRRDKKAGKGGRSSKAGGAEKNKQVSS